MSESKNFLTGVGRLVRGSLYDGQSTDMDGKQLVYKSGTQAGQPRVDYFFALAIKKGTEQHWNQTPWGQLIWGVGHASFPNGQANSPTFAWKVIDGDSQIPNKQGRKPCEIEGYAGHWVLNFSSTIAPRIFNHNGSQLLTEKGYVNLGDFIEVYADVRGNDSNQQPGVYLNHLMIAFRAYGDRIVVGPDPKSVGFGQAALPAGASEVPPSTMATPSSNLYTVPGASPAPAPAPYPQILDVPSMAPPARQMTPKAQGTYEQYIAQGWTDALLIQHGLMSA